ncbi:hypothetical protein OLZ33_19460 [Pantoea ananatis]|uniref:hypothetical protein n=1 Tax=Pantoea ananas TaxID=553 RepID=UPI0011A7F68B|nr:hypothetical protein [Pantoea ananatis]MCW1834160.1 hypothetical protein [Pantoea ananatis]
MIPLKTEYSLNSGYPIVRRTLQDKKNLVKKPGFGPESCCAVVEYELRGNIRYAFGNSQMHISVPPRIYRHDWVKMHGEMAALCVAIERMERFSTDDDVLKLNSIKRVYIELQPCRDKCMPALRNIVPNAEVYYSFDHPTQVDEWKLRARELCNV